MLDRLPEGANRDPAVAAAVSAVELAEQSADAGDTADLRRAVEAGPDDHQARFDLAMALFGGGRHKEAAEDCWNSIAATGNGTTARPAASSSNSSRRGDRCTNLRSISAAASRP